MSPAGVSDALTRLRGAQKPPHGTPAYSRFINRPLGRVFAAVAYDRGLTPNQVSAISACFTFAAIAALILFPMSGALGVLVGAGFILGYALDSADGQVARLRGGGSKVGEWLDHMIDCLKVCSIHLAVLVHVYRFYPDPHPVELVLPLVYAAAAGVLFFGLMLTDQLRRSAAGGSRPLEGSLSVVRALAILPSDFGALAVVFVTVGWSAVFMPLYAVMLVGHLTLLAAAIVKWYRVLRALDEESRAVVPATVEELVR